MPSLAALSRPARVAAMRARILRPAKPLALAEQIWKAARPEYIRSYAAGELRFSEYCVLAQKMALVRAHAALRMLRDGGGHVWKQHARDAIRDAAYWRRAATSAQRSGR